MNAPLNSTGFAGVTREEAVARAAALIPLLKEHAATAEDYQNEEDVLTDELA